MSRRQSRRRAAPLGVPRAAPLAGRRRTSKRPSPRTIRSIYRQTGGSRPPWTTQARRRPWTKWRRCHTKEGGATWRHWNYFYPQIAARAGPYTFDRGVEIEVYSAKTSYFDWAKIRFTEQFQPKLTLARKDPAAIELGYNDVFEEVFSGYVAKPYNGGGFMDEITLKDEMLLLEETQINNTFLDTTRRR